MTKRIATGAAALLIVFGVLFAPWLWPFMVFGLVLLFASGRELSRMLGWSRLQQLLAFGASIICISTPELVHMFQSIPPDMTLVISLVFMLLGMAGLRWLPAFWSWTAIWWVAGPLTALVAVHAWTDSHLPHPILLILLPIWAGDTAALFAGKSLGKHKLAPKISPNKTIEGSIGGLLGSALVGLLMAQFYDMSIGSAVLIATFSGVLGQAGDLFESWLKRRSNVKDSGSLLPGHGGVLDRIDSMLLAAAPAAWLMIALGPHLFHVVPYVDILQRK
jgi:phosphatidate cytidylyltransferase